LLSTKLEWSTAPVDFSEHRFFASWQLGSPLNSCRDVIQPILAGLQMLPRKVAMCDLAMLTP
jgi:hypothetical protein